MLLSEKGLGPTEDRVKAVVEAEEPKNATDVHSFLGLANYSSRFISHFAALSEPLRRLTEKETPFEFGPEQTKSFESFKQKMAETCTLTYFDKTAPTKIITDASPVGLGAVLVQEQGGVWTPVCYASRSLTECEQRYSQTEKEALGVAWACERFHAYVYGMKFVVETDHKPLEVIYGPRSRPCARIERCVAGELCFIGQLLLLGTRIVIRKKLQRRTRAPAHEGHLRVVGTKQNLRTKVWWPGMDKAADRHCRACHGCQLVAQPDPPEPIRSTALPDGPWQDLAVDLMGPLPSGHSLLVIVDYYSRSRFYEVEVMQSTTTEKVIDRLADTFCRYG